MPDTEIPPLSERKPRRVWWIVLLSVIGVVLLLAGWLLLERHRAKAALAKYEQRLRAKGEKLTFDELTVPVSSEENQGAELFRLCSALQVGAVLPANTPPLGKIVAPGKVLAVTRQKQWFSADRKKTIQWEQLGVDLKSNADQLDRLRGILQQPALEFPLNYSGGNTRLPHLAKYKHVAQALSASSLHNLRSGRIDAAIDDFEAIALLTRPLDTEPFLISQLVRLAVAGIALNTCWEILQWDGLTESHLLRLQNICTRLRFIGPMIHGLEGDRVMYRDGIRNARSSHAAMTNLLQGYGKYTPADAENSSRVLENVPYHDEISEVIHSVLVRSLWRFIRSYDDERHALEEMQQFIDALRSAELKHSILAIGDFETALRNKSGSNGAFRSWGYLVTGPFMTVISRAHVRAFRMQNQREMTIAAIALKRYQLRHGKYPKSLDELVPGFLREVPVDWMDGQKLRYRPEGDTFVLWSVGEDGKDDGGIPDQSEPYIFWDGPDLVWPQPAADAEVNASDAKLKENP